MLISNKNPRLVGWHWPAMAGEWSGRWESNPRLKLGKLGYYHYTTPATRLILFGIHRVGNLLRRTNGRVAQNQANDESHRYGQRIARLY